MAEIRRLIGMLQASAAQIAYQNPPHHEIHEKEVIEPARFSEKSAPVPDTLLYGLQLAAEKKSLPQPSGELSQDFQTGLKHVLSTLNAIFPRGASFPAPVKQVKETTFDIVNDLAVANCKRIFRAAKDPLDFQALSVDLGLKKPSDIMANRLPVITTSDLPSASPSETQNTASPARGAAMLSSIFKSVRVPEFRFKWQFWAEKGQQQSSGSKDRSATSGAEEYASRPKPLGEVIISVKEFYQHFNNIPTDQLKLRDSIHLFHHGVKPLWEDPRNARGGAWYFRVNKEIAPQLWHEICLLAVGDVLQGAVETKRESFNDDICGITYSVRWNAVQIAVWNRDADNEGGRNALLQTIMDKLSDDLKPKNGSYYYKAHKDHQGFVKPSE